MNKTGQIGSSRRINLMSQVLTLVVLVLFRLAGLVAGISLTRSCCLSVGLAAVVECPLGLHTWRAVNLLETIFLGGTDFGTPWSFDRLLLLASDIEPNPGPQVSSTNRYRCVVCSTKVRNQGICCDSCDRWCHLKCAWLSDEECYRLGKCIDSWYCPACCLPNFTTFFETSTTTDLDVTASNLPIHPTSVSLVHLNIRSLLPKVNEISLLVSNHHLDVLTLSETWLDE